MKTGTPSHSSFSLSPIATPIATPISAEIAIPIASGARVTAKAAGRLPSAIMPTRAMKVSEKVGKEGLTGMRPAYSQAATAIRIDRTRSVSGCCAQSFRVRARLGAGAGTAAWRSPSAVGDIGSSRGHGETGRRTRGEPPATARGSSAADLGAGTVERPEGPEILDLEVGGIAGHLAGLRVEDEVGFHGRGGAAALVEHAVLQDRKSVG